MVDQVEQVQFDIQLKVWKELAISKQLLMRSASEALNLDPNCTPDELRQALDSALKKVAESDSVAATAQHQARQAIAETDRKLVTTVQAQHAAQADAANLKATLEKMTNEMATERASMAKELQQLKAQIAEKDKAIKAINTALADTPDNVLKKMKTLKKERQDEADARRTVETSFTTLRKEKQEQDKQLADLRDTTPKLVTQYRELHTAATQLHEQLKPLIADQKDLPALPVLDTNLLEAIEGPDKDKDAKGNKKK